MITNTFDKIHQQVDAALTPLFRLYSITSAGTDSNGKPVASVSITLFEEDFCHLWDLVISEEMRDCFIRSLRRKGKDEKTGKPVLECKCEMKLFE